MLEVGLRELNRIVVNGPEGNCITINCGSKAVLTVAANTSIKEGLLVYDMKKAAEEIATILDNEET